MSHIHVRLPHFFIHWNISQHVTQHVHDHSYASLPHPPSKQTDAITKVNNWMNDGSVCSNPSSSAEAETAASSQARATYAEAAAASHTQPPALDIASPIHSRTYSNIYKPQRLYANLKPSSSTTSLQNIHARKLKSSCDDNFQGFVMR